MWFQKQEPKTAPKTEPFFGTISELVAPSQRAPRATREAWQGACAKTLATCVGTAKPTLWHEQVRRSDGGEITPMQQIFQQLASLLAIAQPTATCAPPRHGHYKPQARQAHIALQQAKLHV